MNRLAAAWPAALLAAALAGCAPDVPQALGTLESEGQIWRHVGKGTFLGNRPTDSLSDIASLAKRTNPAELMRDGGWNASARVAASR